MSGAHWAFFAIGFLLGNISFDMAWRWLSRKQWSLITEQRELIDQQQAALEFAAKVLGAKLP